MTVDVKKNRRFFAHFRRFSQSVTGRVTLEQPIKKVRFPVDTVPSGVLR